LEYKALNKQTFKKDSYSLVPIRFEDRYEIMKWRNEQIYHLRQKEPLTIEQQDAYFENVVAKLFDQEQPNQILFSFLKNEELIGYGGLVHINWEDRNAEVSFLSKNVDFLDLWLLYLDVLKKVAFLELNLNKIYTYAYDIRPELYGILESSNFILESIFSNHVVNGTKTYDVRVHSCFNPLINFWRRQALLSDARKLYEWANDATIRAQSLQPDSITWSNHLEWFYQKVQHPVNRIFIYYHKNQPVGSLRLDGLDEKYKISYLVDVDFRGKGFGSRIIEDALMITQRTLIAEVKTNNLASNKVFEKHNFKSLESTDNVNTWIYAR
jgi:RimJ/RimL family protein N-acetyltransferase